MNSIKFTWLQRIAQRMCGSSMRMIGAMSLLMASATVANAAITPTRPKVENDTFLISNASELYWLADSVNQNNGTLLYVKQTADIVLNGGSASQMTAYTGDAWMPIGDTLTHPFMGVYDGQGYSISGLACARQYMASLFGYAQNAEIKNVTVKNSYFFSLIGTAGICAGLGSSSMDNCKSENNTIVGVAPKIRFGQVAGICGAATNAQITNCKNTSTVNGSKADCVGGIVGIGQGATINNCANEGAVLGQNYVGGIAGFLYYSEVSECMQSADVIATITDTTGNYIGGYVGTIDSFTVVTHNIDTSNFTVSGKSCVGGMVGAFKTTSSIISNYSFGHTITCVNKSFGQIYGYMQDDVTYKNNYYKADAESEDGGMLIDDFKSGKLCYLLNGKSTDSDVYWKQSLYTDVFPNKDNEKIVYYVAYKGDSIYTNEPDTCSTVLRLTDDADYVANWSHADTATYSRKLTNNFGTLCLPFAFDTADVKSDVHFYQVALIKDSAIALSEIYSVKAGQPVIFLTEDDNISIVATDIDLVEDPITNNYLTGTFERDTVVNEVSSKFFLKNDKFYKGNGNFIIPQYRAFIHKKGVATTLNSLGFVFSDEIEGIDATDMNEAIENTDVTIVSIYNLAGQQVSNLESGKMYIFNLSNGKSQKVIIK